MVNTLPYALTSVNMFFMAGSPTPTTTLCCAPLLEGQLTESSADELAVVLKALADPVRLRIVSAIATAPDGEACACDLPALVDRSQPTVSHHLGQLVAAGILAREQRGKWAWFALRRESLTSICAALGAGCEERFHL